MEKYLKRNSKMPVEDQIKFWLYFGDMTVSAIAGSMNYASFHGGGSPIMEQIDFTGEGARLRDELAVLIQELEETCVKFEDAKQRKLERDAKLAEKRAAKALAGAAS